MSRSQSHRSSGSRILELIVHTLGVRWHHDTLAGRVGSFRHGFPDTFKCEESELGRMGICAGEEPGKLRPGKSDAEAKCSFPKGEPRSGGQKLADLSHSSLEVVKAAESPVGLVGLNSSCSFYFYPHPKQQKKPQTLLLNNCSVLTGEAAKLN